MTIKRRLFKSNILMLVVPVILIVTVAAATLLAMINLFGYKLTDFAQGGNQISQAVTQVRSLSDKWTEYNYEYDSLVTDIDAVNNKYGGGSMAFAICIEGKRLYTIGEFTENPVVVSALLEPGGTFYLVNDVFLYTQDAGVYKVVVMNSNYQISKGSFDNERSISFLGLQAIMILSAIAIIIITNQILTRRVFKHIMGPLDTLSYGVRQISDGNLGYRIEYTGKDEFTAICGDFNEMARRLMEMVNARMKDEENRKELIAGISHDLRTPLTSIKTYVEGLELGVAKTPETKSHYLDTIKNKTKDMEHIVNQLFMFSKLDLGEFPVQMERIDIGRWLSDFLMGVSEEYCRKGLKIVFGKCKHDVMVDADSVLLRNVMTNVFDNSLKYGDKEQVTMSVRCRLESAYAEITLTDNGPGVPEDTLDKMFNVFYRGDKSRSNISQGNGLGLAISAKIVERMGGTIQGANAQEGGLSIIISLPVGGDKQ